jgi:putative ABC transport system substrate-binding protein
MPVGTGSRRDFLRGGLTLVGASLLSGCGDLPWQGQPTVKARRLGLFHVGLDHVPPSFDGLRAGLSELGYEEGKHIEFDWRNLADEAAAYATAREFVARRVDLIVAFENQTIRAAKAATTDIPIVFLHVTDPVGNGIVTSLAYPGGNLTGFAGWPDLPGKKLELYKEVIPSLRRLLVLSNPRDAVARRVLLEARSEAAKLNLDLVEREASDRTEVEEVFGALSIGEADGVFLVSPDLQTNFGTLIIELALAKRLPVSSNRKEWVERGSLWSYGANLVVTGRASAGRYVDKILKGARPADLPVEENDILELAINLKTALTLGLTIPQSILSQATTIIQ